ncbi:MAG TPA: hemerythrin domain-containing protein [Myxococcales bacterium]|nr:hemerythrin domain-containing protein [Myxococcales bacterium]
MDAITLLKQQHDEVEEAFEKFEGARGRKRSIFEKIADDLAVHAAIEEKHFYPASKSRETEPLLRESVEEHLSVKRLIADAMACEPGDPQFDAKVAVLKEQVLEHAREEEKELFPKVKKLLSRDELAQLGETMEEMAEELKSGGSPRNQVPSETGAPAPI